VISGRSSVRFFTNSDTPKPVDLKRSKKIILFLVLMVSFVFSMGQPEGDSLKHRTPSTIPDREYFKSWFNDGKDLVISPFRWNQGQWMAFSGVVGGTVLLISLDAQIQLAVQKSRTNWMDQVATYGLEPWGSGVYTIPALVVMYGAGAITKNDKAKYTALKGVEAYLFAAVSAQILKQLTHRHRPYEDNPPNPNIWEGPFQPIDNSSFPSGHSTAVFAVATVVAFSYAKTIWVPVLCYSIAGMTAASRVYQNDHWMSDVFIGSALGFAIGSTIINNQLKRLEIMPFSHNGAGIMLVYKLD